MVLTYFKHDFNQKRTRDNGQTLGPRVTRVPVKIIAQREFFVTMRFMDTRATCLNCMDGRAQLPVLTWIKANYPVDFVDVITEAGMDGVLARQEDISEIRRSIRVSVELNRSTRIFVVGHHDCRGNPVEETRHRKDIADAVTRLRPLWPGQDVIGLWVNDRWQVEPVS